MADEDVIYLEKGGVYFYALFFDENLTIPSIETFIFEGMSDGFYFFCEAEDRSIKISFGSDEMVCIYDHKALSVWLLEDHSPKHPMLKEYKYRCK